MKPILLVSAAALAFAAPALASPDHSGDGETEFRALFKELIETNTAHSAGSCTQAAGNIANRLKAAGFKDSEIHRFAPDDAPKDGGLVAVLPGSDPKAKGILLLAHIDVVEARREDWTRDPFTLVEENGQFYGRGVADDKGQAAIFTDLLIRYRREGYVPRRPVKLALTCGEETDGVFNGAQWLTATHKDWIDAEFAINEDAYGVLDDKGNRVSFEIEAAQKVYQDFTLETVNPGGHSSRPRPDNALYQMTKALDRVEAYRFPVKVNDATRGYFARMSPIIGGSDGHAMKAFADAPGEGAAADTLSRDPAWNALLRTTCVATMIEGGHAPNALPQSVKANVNCRIFPGTPVPEVQLALATAIADPGVRISLGSTPSPATPAPSLPPELLKPLEGVVADIFPGTPVVPTMEVGASDGIYTTAVGIPTYGFYGFFETPDEGNIHGLNEHVGVKDLMDGRRLFYKLIKLYADRK